LSPNFGVNVPELSESMISVTLHPKFGDNVTDFGDIAQLSITLSPNFGDNVPELSEINDFGYFVSEMQ
jgi:hypothetical protein